MKLRVVLYNVIERTESQTDVALSEGATLADLTEQVGCPSAEVDFGAAFPVCDAYSTNVQVLPFACRDGGIVWQAEYAGTRVSDALRTLKIADNTLRLNVGMPQAGGPGVIDAAVLWQQFYDAIRAVDPVVGVGGALLGVGTFLRRLLSRNKAAGPPEALAKVPPGPVFSFVVREDEWVPWELAAAASITREDAVNLLRLCRFRWDPHSQSYRRTSDTDRVITALSEVEQFDRGG